MANKSWFPAWGDRHRDVEQFRGFKSQIDSLFEDWFGRSMGGVLAPRVDIAEDDTAVTLTAALPGAREVDIAGVVGGRPAQHQGRKAVRACRKEGYGRSDGSPHGALLWGFPAHADAALPGRPGSGFRAISGRSSNH
jgi:hypothetical protein